MPISAARHVSPGWVESPHRHPVRSVEPLGAFTGKAPAEWVGVAPPSWRRPDATLATHVLGGLPRVAQVRVSV